MIFFNDYPKLETLKEYFPYNNAEIDLNKKQALDEYIMWLRENTTSEDFEYLDIDILDTNSIISLIKPVLVVYPRYSKMYPAYKVISQMINKNTYKCIKNKRAVELSLAKLGLIDFLKPENIIKYSKAKQYILSLLDLNNNFTIELSEKGKLLKKQKKVNKK